jgi:hypothetical protein
MLIGVARRTISSYLEFNFLWRTDAPCTTCISAPNKQKNSRNIIGKLKTNRIRSAFPIRAGNTSLLFLDFFITFYFEVNIPSKSNKQKKIILCWRLEGTGSRSVSQRYESADSDLAPYQNVTDPEHLELLRYFEIESRSEIEISCTGEFPFQKRVRFTAYQLSRCIRHRNSTIIVWYRNNCLSLI